MKAKLYDQVQTSVDLQSEFNDVTLPKGSMGTVIECYDSPEEGYSVDLAIPNPFLVGGSSYENVLLRPSQFVVCPQSIERAAS
jgi:Domain of unknown function (DUF4926)